MKPIKDLFLTSRFFYGAAVLIATTILAHPFPLLLPLAKTGGILFLVVVAIDFILLFNKSVVVEVKRKTPTVLSLGDSNPVTVTLTNKSGLALEAEFIDELPEQLQERNFSREVTLVPQVSSEQRYSVRPLSRGEYAFGDIHVFIRSAIGLVSRHLRNHQAVNLPVYPSIIQMKKYEIKTFARTATEYGVKKVRRIGHSYEFEHIKQYLRGDDFRSINWKATSRRANLMVNLYQDEKSQQVYCIIDKSRIMHMPFHGLSLFDYAVNASLVISNIALGKQDKAGLITFAETPKALVKAERGKLQLKKIMETLYREKEGRVEANYENMYTTVRKFINGRCLLLLYTNFESIYALHRVLPQLRKLNDQHLLVVIFFENTEITRQTSANVDTVEDIYTQATAEHFALTKVQLAQELKQFGIMSILTPPEHLTVTTINKYLELKSRGMI
jgi:uncharacterized protein (DUF58 family)